MKDIFLKIGGRKLWVTIIAMAAGVAVEVTAGEISVTLAGLIGSLATAFIGGNAYVSGKYEKHSAEKEAVRADKKAKAVAPVDEKKLEEVKQEVATLTNAVSGISDIIEDSVSGDTAKQGQEILLNIQEAVVNTNKLLRAAMGTKQN